MSTEVSHAGLGAAFLRSHPDTPMSHLTGEPCAYCDERITTEAGHLVYPDGPTCQPNCPGPHSMYHDGYADGYERGEAEARAAAAERVRALPTEEVMHMEWDARGVMQVDTGVVHKPRRMVEVAAVLAVLGESKS